MPDLCVSKNRWDAYLVRTQVYADLGDADKAIASLEKYIELTGDTVKQNEDLAQSLKYAD